MRLLVSCRQYFWYVHKPLFDAVLSVGATSAVVEFSVGEDRAVVVSLDAYFEIPLAAISISRAADAYMCKLKARYSRAVRGMRIVIRPRQKRIAYFVLRYNRWERALGPPSGVRHEA